MKNKNKNKIRILVPPEDIPKELCERLKKYSTVKINSDNVKLLINYPPFIEKITSLRNNFPVPKLSRQKDRIKTENPPLTRVKSKNLSILHCDFRPDPQLRWFNSLSIKEQVRLETEIDQVLQEFSLPLSFDWRTWLIFYLLYNDEALYLPLYNFEPVIPFPKTPLTTDEKRALRQMIKFRKKGAFGLDDNKKLLQAILKEYKKAFKTKNRKRSLKNIEKGIKSLEKKDAFDYADWKPYRKTDRDLIAEIWEDADSLDEINQLLPKLWKIRERFKKAQIQRLKKNEK